MARTNIADVRIIITTSLEDGQITSFISDTNLIVTSKFTGVDIDDDILEAIEKWLTAHFIAMSQKRQLSEQKVGEASVKYAGKFGLHLEHTTYGQMVIFLDPTNTMIDASKTTAKLRSINPDRTAFSSS